MKKIFVTKATIPPLNEYVDEISDIWETHWLTNMGSKYKKLQEELKLYLDTDNIELFTNGHMSLELSLQALGLKGEVITTPFTFASTTHAIVRNGLTPVFCDINPDDYTIDVSKIEALITEKTSAILPVHVYGNVCDVEGIERIADKYNLKVIYDAAHAFASVYKGRALSGYGDIATLSFHATKLFHTVEGGACIVRDEAVNAKLDLIKRFGHNGDTHYCLGINGKQSEFHAAMGLAVFPHLAQIMAARKQICEEYDRLLAHAVGRPAVQKDLQYNYAYYPVVFRDEAQLLRVFAALNKAEIYPRRYFYPSLNTLPYLPEKTPCPVSQDICSRIACLPLYPALALEDVRRIAKIVLENL